MDYGPKAGAAAWEEYEAVGLQWREPRGEEWRQGPLGRAGPRREAAGQEKRALGLGRKSGPLLDSAHVAFLEPLVCLASRPDEKLVAGGDCWSVEDEKGLTSGREETIVGGSSVGLSEGSSRERVANLDPREPAVRPWDGLSRRDPVVLGIGR
ncbi:hypothetical protein K2173_019857 [Erythroxylum novogranatense]|uniref:Uncharacterized protein n=1 Tax=Erythroxylum novogranatense TaxID=1862640 RepID=A0AAV8SN36_9ROSI|nr:hypothetical protein K2173_019857 [Erythroxylum novogranatense]